MTLLTLLLAANFGDGMVFLSISPANGELSQIWVYPSHIDRVTELLRANGFSEEAIDSAPLVITSEIPRVEVSRADMSRHIAQLGIVSGPIYAFQPYNSNGGSTYSVRFIDKDGRRGTAYVTLNEQGDAVEVDAK